MKTKRPCVNCGEDDPRKLSRHHIFPVRWFGRKDNHVVVYLCTENGCGCHRSLEALITKREKGKKRSRQFYMSCFIDFITNEI